MRRGEAQIKAIDAAEAVFNSGEHATINRRIARQFVAVAEALGLIKFDDELTPERQWVFLTADARTSPAIKHSDLKVTLEANGYLLVEQFARSAHQEAEVELRACPVLDHNLFAAMPEGRLGLKGAARVIDFLRTKGFRITRCA